MRTPAKSRRRTPHHACFLKTILFSDRHDAANRCLRGHHTPRAGFPTIAGQGKGIGVERSRAHNHFGKDGRRKKAALLQRRPFCRGDALWGKEQV